MSVRNAKKRIETVLDSSLFERFDRERKRDGYISLSEAVRMLIIRYVNEKENKK